MINNQRNLIFTSLCRLILATATIAATPAHADETIDIANPPPIGEGFIFTNNLLTITHNGNYTLTGTTSTNRILINPNITATITLHNANLTSTTASPLTLSPDGCNITLRILGENTLTNTITEDIGEYCAALQVEDAASITIEGNGSLTATGGYAAAGIGSSIDSDAGNITITGGIVTANGGWCASAIGGGYQRSVSNVSITGGSVTANGGVLAAGIGGGVYASGGNINISGGVITATGGNYGAGIGSGQQGQSGTIRITGGSINATGGYEATGIGGGCQGDGGSISISGGVVLAIGGEFSPGIGCGYSANNPGNITITGGSVYAIGGAQGSGIGVGANGPGNVGSINISGGTTITTIIGMNGTPTTVSGPTTAIITNSINTTVFGAAKVLTGVNVTQVMIESMANKQRSLISISDNTHTTVYDTTHIHDTVRREVTLTYRDTVHDTLFLYHHDTLWVHIILADTVRKDTIVYAFDTAYVPPEHHDTLLLPLEIVRELHDTTYVHDTVRKAVERQIIVVIDESGAHTAVRDTLIASPASGNLFYIDGIDAVAPFAIYALSGELLFHGNTQPVALPGSSPFVVAQDGRYYCLLK